MLTSDERLTQEISNLVKSTQELTVDVKVLVEKMGKQSQDMSEQKVEMRSLDGRLRSVELTLAEQKPTQEVIRDFRKWAIALILAAIGSAISIKTGVL